MCYANYFPVILSAPVYFANASNRWDEVLIPHLNRWLFVLEKEAVVSFYEGSGGSVPRGIWLRVMGLWLPFFVVLSFVMLCVMIILRRQWVEYEWLSYPLVQLPLCVIEVEGDSLYPPIFRNCLFWIGFCLVFILGSMNALRYYFPEVPSAIQVYRAPTFHLFRGSLKLIFRLSFIMIGFTYLVSTTLSFSIWFLYLSTMLARGLMIVTGYRIMESMDVYSYVCGGPFFSHFQAGALVALVMVGLWQACHHIVKFLRGRRGRRFSRREWCSRGSFHRPVAMVLWTRTRGGGTVRARGSRVIRGYNWRRRAWRDSGDEDAYFAFYSGDFRIWKRLAKSIYDGEFFGSLCMVSRHSLPLHNLFRPCIETPAGERKS